MNRAIAVIFSALLEIVLTILGPYLIISSLNEIGALHIADAGFFKNFWSYFGVGLGITTLLNLRRPATERIF